MQTVIKLMNSIIDGYNQSGHGARHASQGIFYCGLIRDGIEQDNLGSHEIAEQNVEKLKTDLHDLYLELRGRFGFECEKANEEYLNATPTYDLRVQVKAAILAACTAPSFKCIISLKNDPSTLRLALQFSNTAERDTFIKCMGVKQKFQPRTDKPISFPMITEGDDNNLYFYGYKAANGEFGLCFPNKEIRNNFRKLLNISYDKRFRAFAGTDETLYITANLFDPSYRIELESLFSEPLLPITAATAQQDPGTVLISYNQDELAPRLRVQFTTQEKRDECIQSWFGTIEEYTSAVTGDVLRYPIILDGDDCAFTIHAYRAKNGELAACFPNNRKRATFIEFLNLTTIPDQARIYPAQANVIYFDKQLFEGKVIKANYKVPMITANASAASASAAPTTCLFPPATASSSTANSSASKADEQEPPTDFICPITLQVMTDPVITVDGFTFEKTAIETWFIENNTNPLTNEVVTSKQLTPNRALKNTIEQWVDKHAEVTNNTFAACGSS